MRGASKDFTTLVHKQHVRRRGITTHPCPSRQHNVAGVPRGFLLDPTKIILVVSAHNLSQAERFSRGRCHGEALPGGLYPGCCTTSKFLWQEGAGLGGRDPDNRGGGLQAPSDCIQNPIEVPPTVMGLCAASHQGTGGGLLTRVYCLSWRSYYRPSSSEWRSTFRT